ncbi:unnamed protein product [Polarella glacialis]|uniref:Uncharacterized protein n=1 Tax=Polarella glacialis TaxID=89957 RepID=A0A813D8D6_POLGL|nr:unnamed protein product [Polarella glacialis]
MVDSTMQVAHDASQGCWSSGFSAAVCCDLSIAEELRAPCWDEQFTSDRCCREQQQQQNLVGQGASLSEAPGRQAERDFERGNNNNINNNNHYNRVQSFQPAAENCWSGGLFEELCCDLNISATGLDECWDGQFTFAVCCTGLDHQLSITPSWEVVGSGGEVYNNNNNNSNNNSNNNNSNNNSSNSNNNNSNKLAPAVSAEPPPSISCWGEGFTESWCCDRAVSSQGRAACWQGVYNFATCCQGSAVHQQQQQQQQQSSSACEGSFRTCVGCVASMSSSRFGLEEWQSCAAGDGYVRIAALPKETAAYAFCLPVEGSCEGMSATALAAAVHRVAPQLPIFHEETCSASWRLQDHVALLTIAFVPCVCYIILYSCGALRLLPVGRRWSCLQQFAPENNAPPSTTRPAKKAPLPSKQAASIKQRLPQVDLLRVAATLSTMLMYMESLPWAKQNLRRLTDIFGATSVVLMVQSPPKDLPDSIDKVWRRLVRQWPISFLPRFLMAGFFCPRAESCVSVVRDHNKYNHWSFMKALLFDDMASGTCFSNTDLCVCLVVTGLQTVEVLAGGTAFWAALLSVLASCMLSSWHDPVFMGSPNYYNLNSYRLPMALLVLVAARSLRLRAWGARRPLLRRLVLLVFLSLGWAACPFEFSAGIHDELQPCAHGGWIFLMGGVFFHLGIVACCVWPEGLPLGILKGLSSLAARAAELTFSVLQFRPVMISLSWRCEKPPWLSGIERLVWDDQVIFYSGQYSTPWWSVYQRLGYMGLCFPLSALAAQCIEKPWIAVAGFLPYKLTRVTTLVVACLVLVNRLGYI